jgi:hypothetical protein
MRLNKNEPAVFLGLGIVSAQLQGFTNLRLRQRPMIGSTDDRQHSPKPKNPRSAPATVFFEPL